MLFSHKPNHAVILFSVLIAGKSPGGGGGIRGASVKNTSHALTFVCSSNFIAFPCFPGSLYLNISAICTSYVMYSVLTNKC
jgi:hypothetical protein